MIPKNTLIRKKVAKSLKRDYEPLVKKIDTDELQGGYHYRRRLNQNIKKRLTSLLTETSVSESEMADLLELLNERAIIDGFELSDCEPIRNHLNKEYGDYKDMYTTIEDIDEEEEGFIPYHVKGHVITDGSHESRINRQYYERGY